MNSSKTTKSHTKHNDVIIIHADVSWIQCPELSTEGLSPLSASPLLPEFIALQAQCPPVTLRVSVLRFTITQLEGGKLTPPPHESFSF